MRDDQNLVDAMQHLADTFEPLLGETVEYWIPGDITYRSASDAPDIVIVTDKRVVHCTRIEDKAVRRNTFWSGITQYSAYSFEDNGGYFTFYPDKQHRDWKKLDALLETAVLRTPPSPDHKRHQGPIN